MASANPPSSGNQPPVSPTGNLEHLFRQQLAEAEVRPRANFWDQLDHELVASQHADVLRQNAMYRQRAATYRMAAAASLLLALGFGSWAYMNQAARPGAAGLAAGSAAAGRSGLGLLVPTTPVPRFESLAELMAALEDTPAATTRLATTTTAGRNTTLTSAPAYPATGNWPTDYLTGYPTDYPATLSADYAGTLLAGLSSGGRTSLADWGQLTPAANDLGLRDGLGLNRPDQRPALATGPTVLLAAAASRVAGTPPEPLPKASAKLWKRLQLGGSYAVSVFNPNINFSRTDARSQADPVTTALRTYYQQDAEREYRRNLRSGLSQRAALTASYRLGKHWTLGTGAEWAENRASSATSFGFLDGKQVGEESPAIFARSSAASFGAGNFAAPQPKATSYRYRTAAIPVSLTYGSPKNGLSFYARAGAVMSILLSSRSELEGSPADTRTYDIRSAESPYRTLFASGRLGGGVRYQPVLSTWNLTVGPSAEVFVTSLNANPSQRAARQTRPYSLGLEATLEFGSPKAMPGVQ